jgi:hypothetical protein
MAQIIKIKRSTSAATPSSALSAGELAYSYNSDKLFIGDGSNNLIIGGELYTGLFPSDINGGTLEAGKILVADSNSKINNLLVDNLQINGNTVSSTSGNLTLSSATGSISVAGAATEILIVDGSATAFTITEGSANYLTLDTTNNAEKVIFNKQIAVGTAYTLPTADGTNGQALVTNGSGAVTFTDVAATLTVGGDSGTADVALLTDDLKIVGAAGLTTTSSKSGTDVTVSMSIDNGGISTVKLAADAVTGAKIADDAINSEHLVDGSIDDAHIATGTIANNKLANSSITLGGQTISLGGSVSALTGFTGAITTSGTITGGALDIDNVEINGQEISTSSGNLSFNPASNIIDANSSRITNVTDPTQAQDAATKSYVDGIKQALDIKDSVKVASTANITVASALINNSTVDGVTVATGDRVLLKNQTDASQNGIYVVVGRGAASRSDDANSNADVTSGLFVFVEQGTANGDNGYVLTTNSVNLGTTDLTFTQFSGAGAVEAGTGLSRSGTTISANVDDKSVEISGDNIRIKNITGTAVGDLLVGVASDGGYTSLAKPSAAGAILNMNTSGVASWSNVLDGGSF